VAGEVLPIRPDSKVPEGVTGLPSAFNRGSDLNHEPQPSLDTITGNVATLTTRPPRRRSAAVFGGVLKWRGLRRKKDKKAAGSENRTRVARLTGAHADRSATTPCWQRAQNYAIRTKPRSFKGGTESHDRIFAVWQQNATRHSRVEENPKSWACTPRNLNSSPPFSYYQGNDFSGPTTWL